MTSPIVNTLSTRDFDALDELCANVIRGLAMDGVQKADSGHPGMPMGMATVAHVVWTRFLRHNPADEHWFNRDRFVLSAGPRLDAALRLLHLAGYDRADGRAEAVPPARLEDARPPRVQPHAGRRDDDRPAGAGLCHGRRHGAGRGASWPPPSTGPASTSSTTTPTPSSRTATWKKASATRPRRWPAI